MATTTRVLVPQGTYATASRNFPAADIPNRVKTLTFRLESASFTNPATKLSFACEESLDGGQTWRFLCGFEAEGGFERDGVTARQPSVRVELTKEQREASLIRGSVAVVGSITGRFVAIAET